jgi:gliding motility-associated-like protein
VTGFTSTGAGNINDVLTNNLGTPGTVTYVVTPTANGCTGSPVSFVVTVNSMAPVGVAITSLPAGPVCDGVSVTFTATPTNGGSTPTYQWQLNGTNVGTNSATYTNGALPVGNNTVSVSLTSSLSACVTGNPASATYSITVNALPNASLNASGPYCIDEAASNLTAVTSGGTFSGAGITNATVGTFDPATAGVGTHTITYNITDPNTGCSNSSTQNYVVNPLPSVTFGVIPDVCVGSNPVTLNQGSPSGGTYSGTGVANNMFSPATAGNGTHTLTYTYTDPLTGCTNAATQMVTVNTDIVVTVAPLTSSVCPGASTTLFASGANSYSWFPPTGLSSSMGGTVVATPLASAVYTVTGTSTAGCTGSVTTTVNVYPLFGVHFIADPMFGCAPLDVNFAFVPDANWTDDSWNWDFDDPASGNNNGDTVNITHTFMEEGNYEVQFTATNIYGCVETGSLYVSAYTRPEADFIIHPEVVSMDDPTVTFVDQSEDANAWSWNFGDPGTGPNDYATGPSTNHVFSDTGTFYITLIVESNYGCADTIIKPYYIFPSFYCYFPNAFTPNGDGVNDLYMPYIEGLDVSSYSLMIYDRWGTKVFESTDPNKFWTGKVLDTDKAVKQDTYTWILIVWDEMGNKYKRTGRVTVLD